MSTNGTIALRIEGTTYRTYNHSDSYPTWLGVEAGKFIRDAADSPEVIASQVKLMRIVEEDAEVTPADAIALGLAGVKVEHDYYFTMRDFQGKLADILRVGFWLNWTWGDNQEWGYLADFDARELVITYDQKVTSRVPFAELDQDDAGILAQMAIIQRHAYPH